ncbi:MAG TPA: hypothetical protein PLJ14_02845 [Accumulibacter sp.]|nr:hypothetical protein [Accumulibacter sp.]HNE13479.1 hypothetical protein [Accumulibacter sp.]HNJ99562.1 hypothetical protein [Accumulibacter sp.]HNL12709.1 hypothetical protein [Accumulibacter sp.]HNL76943.1 hypothetical protein [Accumulibacter sp.]
MIRFTIATQDDDVELRALLRENSMASWVTMAVEREPSFFAGMNRFGRDMAMIARDGDRAVGMYVRSEHPVHLNGHPARIGYLGALRIDAGYRRRVRALRDGYAAAFAADESGVAEFCYTCIASENRAARRLLEANLKGLPKYVAAGQVIALAMSSARGKEIGHWLPMRQDEGAAVCAWHNTIAASRQFSPELNPMTLNATGADFFVCHDEAGEPAACMALWNQNSYKQVVARAYRQPLATLRPLYNVVAAARRQVMLPRPGQAVDQTYLAFFAADAERAPPMQELVADALAKCSTPVLTMGLSDRDPDLQNIIVRFRPSSYAMTVYTVCYADLPGLDGRPVQPEIAVL